MSRELGVTKSEGLAGAERRQWLAVLDRSVRPFYLVLSWIGATVVFLAFSVLLGGPTEGDASEVVYGTWAVAHGRLACVYPAHQVISGLGNPFTLAAPLYGFISGALAFLLRIGHSVPFPGSRALGPNCSNGFRAMFHWSIKASAIVPTIRLGYIVWLVLLAGVVAVVRASGRGRDLWEVAAVFAVALAFPVEMCLTYYFHPQDVLAMGLVLLALAGFLRGRWVWCGVALGLAVCSQQFAVLAAVPLVVLAPRGAWTRMIPGAAVVVAVVDGAVLAATGGRGVETVLLGSSRVGQAIRSHGGTVVATTGLHGVALFVVARLAPIAVGAALALWARRRCAASPRPELVVVVVAAGVLARLVFEENIYGYYFMAFAVALVVLEVVRRRCRRSVLAWFALLAVGFEPEHVAFTSNLTSYGLNLYWAIPIVLLAAGVLVLVADLARRRINPGLFAWVVFVLLTGETKLFNRLNPLVNIPEWAWQVVLVGMGIALLIPDLRSSATFSPSFAVVEESRSDVDATRDASN